MNLVLILVAVLIGFIVCMVIALLGIKYAIKRSKRSRKNG